MAASYNNYNNNTKSGEESPEAIRQKAYDLLHRVGEIGDAKPSPSSSSSSRRRPREIASFPSTSSQHCVLCQQHRREQEALPLVSYQNAPPTPSYPRYQQQQDDELNLSSVETMVLPFVQFVADACKEGTNKLVSTAMGAGDGISTTTSTKNYETYVPEVQQGAFQQVQVPDYKGRYQQHS
uniref:Uncharacterized protein n=1 Tax=Grammatophora oceanica TaxID=210454 RepID=A0A7S1YK20_9STRA